MIFKIKNKKGFSIGETVLSVFVLVIGISAVFGLIANSISHSIGSRDHIIASELAQGGVELMRNVRDNNILSNESYDQDLTASGCIDHTRDTVGSPNLVCAGGSYVLDLVNGKYLHNGGSNPSRFSRRVYSASSGSGVIVGSVVWWGQGSEPAVCGIGSKCIQVEAFLENL